MALISIPVSSKSLSNIEIPGVREDPSGYHITLAYLGDNVPISNIIASITSCYKAISNISEFNCELNYVTMFPKGKHGFPIVVLVDSPLIYTLRDNLVTALTESNVPFANNFVFYRPHITLSYSNIISPPVSIKESILVDKLQIWPEDKGNNGEIVIPLKKLL